MGEKKLVCPWLPSTLVGDNGIRVAAFESCYRETCPYWGVIKMKIKAGVPDATWGCRRAERVIDDA